MFTCQTSCTHLEPHTCVVTLLTPDGGPSSPQNLPSPPESGQLRSQAAGAVPPPGHPSRAPAAGCLPLLQPSEHHGTEGAGEAEVGVGRGPVLLELTGRPRSTGRTELGLGGRLAPHAGAGGHMLLPLGHVMAGEGAGLAHQTIFSDLFSSPHAPSCSPAPCTYTSSSFLVTTTLATTSWFHSVLLFIVISQVFLILTLSLQRRAGRAPPPG